jgi:RHS repeat-associated protein
MKTPSLRKTRRRTRPLDFELLEDRVLLDAANIFARFRGTLAKPGDAQQIAVTLRAADFTLKTASPVLGFELVAPPGSGLNPAVPQITRADNTTVTPRATNSGLAGNTESLNLSALAYGTYTVTVRGAQGTAGAYQLNIFLAGDVNGDFKVDTTDGSAIAAMMGSKAGDAKYRVEADSNLDGVITSFDYTQWRANVGVATPLRPLNVTLALPGGLYQLPDGTVVTGSSTIVVGGKTGAGDAVALETGTDSGFDEGQTTADSGGSYSFTTGLQTGANTLQVRARDTFGQAAFASVGVSLDTQAPVVTLTSPTAPVTTNANVTLTGQVTDNLAGVASLQAAVDQGAYQAVSFDGQGKFSFPTALPLDGSADGSHTVLLRATDHVGNVSTPLAYTFTLDTTPPVVSVSSPAAGLTFRTDPTVTGQATDTLSGVASLAAAVDTGAFAPVALDAADHFSFTPALPLDGSADGTHVVHFQAADRAGNVSAVTNLPFSLDTTPPVVSISSPAAGLTFQTNPTVTGQVTDALSGVASLAAAVDTGAFAPVALDAAGDFSFTPTLPLDGSADGPHEVHFQAADRAGNVSAVTNLPFTLGMCSASGQFGGWTAGQTGGSAAGHGTVDLPSCGATLHEGDSFAVSLRNGIVIPGQPSVLTFAYSNLGFDATTPGRPRDAFEAALVDAHGNPLVHPIAGNRDAFFNLTEGQAAATGAEASVSGQTVTLDLSQITPGTMATLIFRLVNNDGAGDSEVTLDSVQVTPGSGPGSPPAPVTSTATPAAIDFTHLSDVSASVHGVYGQTSLDQGTQVLYAGLSLRNDGTYVVKSPLLVGITHLSDPSVRVRDADGHLPDGTPYYDFTSLVTGGNLSSGQSTGSRTIAFYDPNGTPFTYDLDVLAYLNQPPAFTSKPNLLAILGHPYTYQATAADPDGDPLTFSLLAGPTGMKVDPATGLVTWTPASAAMGNQAIALRVDDGHGASAEQDYTLAVIEPPPNTPPVFTSSPVVSANVNTPYSYQATAADEDFDSLTFALTSGPAGMTVNHTTGLVQWQPTGNQAGLQNVALTVSDGRGGSATQTYTIDVLSQPGNDPPVITSQPVTQYDIAPETSSPVGPVSPASINVTLGPGQTSTQTVSISLTTPLTLGTTVNATLSTPGEQDGYTFSLAAKSLLYFDSLTDNGTFTWSLTGPAGTAVRNRPFTNSDGVGGPDDPVLSLPAGPYTLTVSGSGQTTGAYSFRLLNLSQATPLTPGVPVNGTLAPADSTTVYQFTGAAGDQYSFVPSANNGPSNADWRLIDPYGNVLFEQNINVSPGTIALLASGTYTLLVEGYIGDTGTVGYSFTANFLGNTPPAPPSGTPLKVGATVNGTLAAAGQQDAYNFTLADDSLLYFDSLTDNNGISWSLTGPGGTAVSNRIFAYSDGDTVSPSNLDPALSLPAGPYTLTVVGSGQTTGAYSFRLLDLSQGAALTPGVPVSGSLSPGNSTAVYDFSASAGATYYFAAQRGGSPDYWRLIDPYGNLLFGNTLGTDGGRLTLTATGTYTLLVEGDIGNTAGVSYGFNVVSVQDRSKPLTVGSTVNGTLAGPSEQDHYTFTLASASLLYFDSLTDNNNFSWSLTGPGGTAVSSRSFAGSDGDSIFGNPALSLPAGPYTLTVVGSGQTTGAYSFRLLDLSQATPLTPGVPVSGSLSPGNSTAVYNFSASAGATYYFASQQGAFPNEWRLIDPYGNQLFGNGLDSDGGRLTLTATGTYTLLVEGDIGNTAQVSYGFNVARVQDTSQALTLGSTVNATMAAPGEQDRYTFTLAGASLLYFDSLTDSVNFSWSLSGPGGTAVSSHLFAASDGNTFSGDPVLSLPAGPYTLTVSGSGQTTGAYSFRLLDLSQGAGLTPGTPVAGTLSPGDSTTVYDFQASAGSAYYFASQQGGSPDYWRLIDPYGNLLFADLLSTDGGRLTLTATGTYTLLVEGSIGNTAQVSYGFNVAPVQDTSHPLTLGSTVNASMADPGEHDNYTFTLANDSLLYFDSLTDDFNFSWSLTGPGGTAVSNLSFTTSDGSSGPVDPALPLPAGPYTLTVVASGQTTGAYSFRLLDLSQATPLTPRVPVSGTLAPANSTNAYRFTGAAGDHYSFVPSTSSFSNEYWRLLDPYGNLVFSDPLGSDPGTITLLASGTYTLLVEGYIGDTGTAGYSFTANFLGHTPPAPPGGTALTVGSTVNGTLAAGQQEVYNFTLAKKSLLYFDSLTNNSGILWSLTGPGGTAVSSRSFAASDGNSFLGDPVLSLPAGSYTLTVAGSGQTTGAYSFRLLDLSQATPLTPGTPVAGTLAPGDSTAVYNFPASAGSSYYFASRQGGGSDFWRLIDPYGNVLFGTALSGDGGRLTLTATGTYTLLVEGYIGNTTSVSYGFNVAPVQDPSQPLTLGSTVNGTMAAPGEQDHYTFTLAGASLLYFDSLTDDGNFSWSLTGPGGTAVSSRSFTASDGEDFNGDPVLSLPAGPYTLTVAGSGQTTGAYSFRLLDLSQGAGLTPGTPVAGTLAPGDSTAVYNFPASAGSSYYFASQQGGGSDEWRLIDPYGNVLFGTTQNVDGGRLTLTATGTYTLLVEGYIGNTAPASYGFNVAPVHDTSQPLTLGSTVNGSMAGPGELDRYTFTLADASRLYFDSRTDDFNFSWSLTGPGGTAVSNRPFTDPDLQASNAVLAVPAGSYTLTVAGAGQTAGAYAFRLVDLSQAPPITPNTALSGTLEPGTTDLRSFQASAGDSYYFESPSFYGSLTVMSALVDPYGKVIFDNPARTDGGELTLTATGTYTVLVRSRFGNTGVVVYILRIDQQAVYVAPSDPAAPVQNETGTLSDQTNPTFDVRFTGDGQTHAFNLNFVAPATNAVIGSIPVAINVEYLYAVRAVDPDGDPLTFTLTQAPAGMQIDPSSGLITWQPTAGQLGPNQVTVRVDDGRGGFDTQSYVLTVVDSAPGTIQGTVFDDLNGDGQRNPTGGNPYYTGGFFQPAGSPFATIGFDTVPGIIITIGPGGTITTTSSGQGPYDGSDDTYVAVVNQANSGVAVQSLQVSSDAGLPIFGFDSDGIASTALQGNQTGYEGPGTSFSGYGGTDTSGTVTLDDGMGNPLQPGWQTFFALEDAPQTVTGQLLQVQLPLAAEPALAGWTMYLDLNHDGKLDPGDPTSRTNAQGQYEFSNLVPGTYTVAEVGQPGWQQTAPPGGTFDAVVQAGQITTVPDFGNEPIPLPPRPPVITSTPPNTVHVGQKYRYNVSLSDPDGLKLRFDLPVSPAGMVVDPETGAVVWTPTADQVGPQTAILRVRDGQGDVLMQDLKINVGPMLPPPVFTSTPTVLDVVAGNQYRYQPHAQAADGDTLTFRLDQAPAGMGIVPGTGLIIWTPDDTQVGTAPVTVTVVNSEGAAVSQSFNLNVAAAGVNLAPTITSTPGTAVGLGQTYRYQFATGDADGDPVLVTLTNVPAGMSIDANLVITWTPTAAQLGPNPVTIDVSDFRGGSAEQSFTVQVVSQPVTHTPIITSTAPLVATVGQMYAYNATGADPDGSPLVWDLDNAPQGMTLDPAQGTIRWTPTVDELGSQKVVLRLTNGQGQTVAQSFNVVVQPVNSPPVITSEPPTQGGTGVPYSYQVSARDADGDPLTYRLTAGPAGMTIDPSTGLLKWVPTSSQFGTQGATIQVDDGRGQTATQSWSVVVVVAPLPPPPTITTQPITVATVGQAYTYQVTATGAQGQTLTYSLGSHPAGMTIDPVSGLVQWTPDATQAGTQPVQVLATDQTGQAAVESFSVTVTVNQPPVITSTAPTTVTAGLLYSYDVQANDPDGDPLTYTLTAGPKGMTLDSNGRLRWSPGIPDIGTAHVSLSVDDDHGAAVTQAFDVTVGADTEPPQVQVGFASPADIGSKVTFVVTATDDVGVTALNLTVGGTPVALDATGRATVTMKTAGNISVVATATDAAGNTGTDSHTLTVINPQVTTSPVVSFDTPADGDVITAPTDVIGTVSDSNLLSYTLSVAPLGSDSFTQIASGTSQVSHGVLGRFDPSLLPNDSYDLRLDATNIGGLESSVDETVNVAGGLKLGNFTLSFTDLTVPVAGIPITLTRTYDSLNAGTSEDFGYGWRLGLRSIDLHANVAPTGLEEDGIYNPFQQGTRVYLTEPGGKREGFTFSPTLAPGPKGLFLGVYNPSFTPDPGVTDQLTVPSFDLQSNPDGSFSSYGGDLPYNPADSEFGGYYVLTTKDGLACKIDGTSGKLDTASNANGDTLTFTDAGIFSSAGPKVLFTRDPQGHITAVTDPAGMQIHYQYDANGNLTAVTDRQGNTTQFLYNAPRPHYLTQVIDPLGNTGVRADYDAQGRLVSETDAAGKAIQIGYDPTDDVETVTDQLGNPTTYVYDDQGNIVKEVDALGGITTRTFDANNNLLSETNPLGRTTSYTYDSHANQLTVTDPLGHVTQYTYQTIQFRTGLGVTLAPFFVQATTTDALGDTTTNSYDGNGNLLSTTDPSGAVTSFTYDASGSPASITDANGGTTSFQYDGAGHLLQQTDALGHGTSYTYDADGNQLTRTTTLTMPSGVRTLVTSTTYDAQGHVLTETDAEGNVTTNQYDAAGQLTATIDPLGNKTSYVYDDRGEQTETINPDGTTTQTQYDAAGHVTAQIDELGRKTQFVYDALGRKTKTTYPDGASTSTRYDAAGEVTAQVDERGNQTSFQYDAAGNQTAVTDALGDQTTSAYDAANRLVVETDPLGHTTRFVLDAAGRTVETDYADGSKSSVTLDAGGRVTARTDQDGITTHYQYDALGRLTAVVDALNQQTKYAYDEAGDLVSQTDANGHVTGYEYDGLGRRTATVLPLGQRSTTAYDGDGNVTATTDFNGATIKYQYDSRNRLTRKLYPDGTSVTYTYTLDGQRATVTDGRGVTQYAYDQRDRLLSRTDPDGTQIAYTYDAAGNRTSVTTPAQTTGYTFDALNRLTAVTINPVVVGPQDILARYTYDAAGNLAHTTLENGTSETRQYDSLNRQTYLENDGPSGVISSYRCTLDADGNRTKVVEDTGRTVQYAYDALFRLIGESITDPVNGNRTITYAYDSVGNRLSMNDSAQGVTTYTYDANDRLLTEALAGQVTQYTYDADGNTLSKVVSATDQTVYHWSADGRMTGADVTSAGGTTHEAYQYDADGIRMATTSNGVETRYLIDTVQPYPEVLLEYRPGGLIVASYVYGDRLLEQTRSGVSSWYLVDALGSTRALTNGSGVVTDRYTYDAFGRMLQQTGNTVNAYLFAGQQRDAATGLDYLRARYLSFAAGRFLSTDTWNGSVFHPGTLNKYLYVGNNPINLIDLSGKQETLAEVSAALAIQTTLQTISTGFGLFKVYVAAQIADALDSAYEVQEFGLELVTEPETTEIGTDLYLLANQRIAFLFEALGKSLETIQKAESLPSLANSIGNIGRDLVPLFVGGLSLSDFAPSVAFTEVAQAIQGARLPLNRPEFIQSVTALLQPLYTYGALTQVAKDVAPYAVKAATPYIAKAIIYLLRTYI